MFDWDRWQEVWHTITRNKLRSFLTAFGVFWGIFMLVVMSGSGYGLENGISSGTKGFAKNSAFFFTNSTSEAYKGFRKGRYWSMRSSDLEMLRQNVPEIENISPVLMGWREGKNVMRGERYNSYDVNGLHPDYCKIESQNLLFGRYLNELDIKEKRKVCVIGERIYREMFMPGENPLGEQIRVSGIYYTVVGVSRPMGKISIGGEGQETVVLPFTTMQQTFRMGDNIHFIAISAGGKVRIGELEERITGLLKSAHFISPTDLQAVMSLNMEKEFKRFSNLFTGIKLLIWIVGTGTLLAGVVGVSNIMLVTVRERTKEIGIRRAIGAKPRVILVQIMSESLVLTLLAGFLGLLAGVGLLTLLDHVVSSGSAGGGEVFFLHPQIPFSIALSANGVLLFCGLLAGLIPTWRALQIKAIDAIREE